MVTINFYSADATRIIRTRTYGTVALAMRAVARAAKRGIPTARALVVHRAHATAMRETRRPHWMAEETRIGRPWERRR